MIKEQMTLAINDFLKGNHTAALAQFESLLKKERNIDLLYNYGYILGELELYEKEQKVYKLILASSPNDIETLINMSVSLNATRNFSESIHYANKAIQINKEIHQAYEARGIAKIGIADIKGGIQDYKIWINILLQDNKNIVLKTYLEDCLELINLPPIYQNEDEIENTRRDIQKKTDSLIERLDYLTSAELNVYKIGKKVAFKLKQFYLAYQQKNDRELNEKTIKILRKLLGDQEDKRIVQKTVKQKRKKLAILSTFQFHPKLFIFDQIADIDRSKYEIEIIILNNKNFITSDLDYHIEHHTFTAENYDETIRKIKDKNYNVIFLPEIGMSIVSKILATEKLATITVTSWLHPITSGSDNVDIFLSGAQMEKNNCHMHYTENLVLLPGIGLKIDPKEYLVKKIKKIENESNPKKFIIGCIQTPFKYHPRMDKIFAKLAKAIPNSEFIFIRLQDEIDAKLISRIRDNFQTNGLDAERIKIFDRMEKNQYKNFLSELDIAIDSIGWSGGNTTLDLLGAGIPTLTIEEELMRANHTAGIYKMIDINELIFKDETNLIEAATELSTNPNKLIEMKKNLINKFSNLQTDSYISNFFNSLE
jgi:protein O-GlcNAc transferase